MKKEAASDIQKGILAILVGTILFLGLMIPLSLNKESLQFAPKKTSNTMSQGIAPSKLISQIPSIEEERPACEIIVTSVKKISCQDITGLGTCEDPDCEPGVHVIQNEPNNGCRKSKTIFCKDEEGNLCGGAPQSSWCDCQSDCTSCSCTPPAINCNQYGADCTEVSSIDSTTQGCEKLVIHFCAPGRNMIE